MPENARHPEAHLETPSFLWGGQSRQENEVNVGRDRATFMEDGIQSASSSDGRHFGFLLLFTLSLDEHDGDDEPPGLEGDAEHSGNPRPKSTSGHREENTV